MNLSDDNQDHELLERYRQASNAESLAPRDAVRNAILEEGRRVAAAVQTPAVGELRRRKPPRWKMPAFATAASVLIATVILAPKLWDKDHDGAASSSVSNPFKQAAVHKAQVDTPADAAAPPVPVVPLQDVPPPKLEGLKPSPSLAERESGLHPPTPVHYMEQSVEVDTLNQNQSARSATDSAATSAFARKSFSLSGELLTAASAGDLAKATELLDQRAASIDERDLNGRTPLILAVGQGRLAMVRLLLARGADPNAVDQAGLTPLKLAQGKGSSEIAGALKEGGAR